MQNSFKVGDRVRLKGTTAVATVRAVGDLVRVEYEYRPGTVTVGLYPAPDLEKAPEKITDAAERVPTRPRASTKSVLPAKEG